MTETFEEIPVEYDGLILEDQLLDHLATPEGATAIWKERLLPEVLPQSEEDAKVVLQFVLTYMDEHRTPPDISVIAAETGMETYNEPIAPVEYVISKLRERYQRRQLRKITERVGQLAVEPESALTHGLDELTRLRLETTSRKGEVSSGDLWDAIDRYRERQVEGLEGITFGYEQIDNHLGGLKIGELSVVLARPKRYKSWQLLKSAADALVDHNVAFATMELSEQEMQDRLLCMVSGVSWAKFKSNTLRQEDLLAMEETAHDLQGHPYKCHIFRPKIGERTPGYLTAYAIEKEAECLYIDQLSWFDGARDDRAWQKIGTIMEELKDAATNFPIYMAAQLNREAVAIDGLADIDKAGLSDMIGQTADNLFAIHASRDMMQSNPKIIQFGLRESRAFEPQAWEIRVDLSKESNFHCIGELDSD